MSAYKYKTNGEPLKCVNCGNTEFKKIEAKDGPAEFTAYECQRCHFVSWFGREFAPQESDQP